MCDPTLWTREPRMLCTARTVYWYKVLDHRTPDHTSYYYISLIGTMYQYGISPRRLAPATEYRYLGRSR